MFFKNLIPYQLKEGFTLTPEALSAALSEHVFTGCKSQELGRFGWTKPHSALNDDALVFAAHGALLICAQKEEKILPPKVIKKALDERIAVIEQNQGRKVYRKEKLLLKDEIILDLLPRAFSNYTQTRCLIIPAAGLIMVDSARSKPAEELLNLLRNSLGSLPVALPDVHHSPAVVMSEWLKQERESRPFTCEDACTLKAVGSELGYVRIKDQSVFDDEVKAHLESGLLVDRLSLTWDNTLKFALDADLSLKGIHLTEELAQALNDDKSDEDPLARLDSDVARMALEYQKLWKDLSAAFGGVVQV
ncbi:recombination-associated protein RdgC [Neptunomonas sp. XY-337]|uniref:recombination-associated protein RdgC n=1 Tax=Neptunomonas sp. XY-337 TaxID=2561897 RepID=UPI0010AA2EE6|nr:recombination-associated protein RdgC [Neptunomonas sp. XY-337]